ncbi:MAG TPA: non-homologous end-joining DNA ligase [Actinomycetales bacterium]|nr:non-homologous end-joining DNA ligase [Actinomycetales bacterium]
MSPDPDTVRVKVDDHVLKLSNLHKVLYPATGTTKGEVLDYYARVAPVMLPHVGRRPVTRKRWPDGVESEPFFEKNVPRGTPDWVQTVTIATPGSSRGRESVTFPLVEDLATLTWLVNLASLEIHVPQWQVGPRGAVRRPDRLVVDLDPGAPAGLRECAELALLVRDRLAEDGLEAVPVTSGSKGLQLYAAVSGKQDADVMRSYAKRLAEQLTKEHPQLVLAVMTRAARPGKVLLDWSQNHAAKTTICPYSLRGREHPNVAAPRTWEEIEDVDGLRQLSFTEVLDRIDQHGDLASTLFTTGPRVPTS